MTPIKAIVTGHSKGLGAAIAADLLARGIPVMGLARTPSASLAARFPALLVQHPLDLGSAQALLDWLDGGALTEFLQDCGLALLVNNAGTVQPVGAMHEQELLQVAMAVSLNVAAPLVLAAAVARARSGAPARVLHVSSGAGSSAYPGWSVYCATKAALDHHARAAALDANSNLRVCSLAPGVIDTDMQAQIRAIPAERFPMKERFVALKQEGGLLAPEQCAASVVAYLLADRFGSKPVDDVRNAG